MFKSINKVIKILTFSDVSLETGFGFMAPIFAIFIARKIQGGGIEVAGFAMAIYWRVKSILQIPFGKYFDEVRGEKDDLWFIVIGNILAASAIFGYIFSFLPWHIYLCQAIYSLGMAMNISGYCAIFTRYIDKRKEAFKWSTRSTFIGIGAGISGALGGIIANRFGFDVLFIGAGIFVLLSAFLPFLIYKDIFLRDHFILRIPEDKGLQGSSLPKG